MYYEKCQRCDINYKQHYEPFCDICRKELAGAYCETEDDDFICPVCGKNPIDFDSEMCDSCRNKRYKGIYS